MQKTFNLFVFNLLSLDALFSIWQAEDGERRGMTRQNCQNGGICVVLGLCVMTWCLLGEGSARAAESELRVGDIEIIRNDIFSPSETDDAGFGLSLIRQLMNGLHVKTRAHVLRRELLFSPGDVFRPELLSETERNLRELGFLNSISVAAVDTNQDGRVRVRVRVRDSWSLQTNVAYSRSASGDQRWSASLSETNFLGEGMTLGTGLGADENSRFSNFWFRRSRMTPAHLVLGVDDSERGDGHVRGIFLTRPFYSLADRWSFRIKALDRLVDGRYYLSQASPVGRGPAVAESLYAALPFREKYLLIGLMARLSAATEGRLWRLGLGVEWRDLDFETEGQGLWKLSDGRWVSLDFLADPADPFTSEQGRRVWPHLWFHTEGRQWEKTRYIWQYGAVEDIPLSPGLALKIGPCGDALGSTRGEGGSLWRAEVDAVQWGNLGPGHWTLQAEVEGQAGVASHRYHRATLLGGWLAHYGAGKSPWLTRIFAEAGHGENLSGDRALVLGLVRGVRTLDFDGQVGDRLARWNVEQGKVLPWEVLGLFNMGGAAFYSGGVAWWDDEKRDFAGARHELGFGLRVGPTRSAGSTTSKIDISWALDGSRGPVFTAISRGVF